MQMPIICFILFWLPSLIEECVLQLCEIVKTGIEKSYQVQAFCEEKGLTLELGVICCAESKNQCWQVEK